MDKQQGLIAILDALGAANYTDAEISRFLESRGLVLKLLMRNANSKEISGDIDASRVTTFTFNDTVLIVYKTEVPATLDDVNRFCLLLRKFSVDSLAKGILFRGSVAVGTFYVDDATNTVMGPAVTDAAAWYDSADWVGIHATPHATLAIQQLVEERRGALEHVLIDYPVPMKVSSPVVVKAINWPKVFLLPKLAPPDGPQDPRAKCLRLLTKHRFPKGSESKHFNAVAFFDHCFGLWKKAKKGKAG
jgi:hypothetical protein